jgi:hypothetical protein
MNGRTPIQAFTDGLPEPNPKPKGDKLTKPARAASMQPENRAA